MSASIPGPRTASAMPRRRGTDTALVDDVARRPTWPSGPGRSPASWCSTGMTTRAARTVSRNSNTRIARCLRPSWHSLVAADSIIVFAHPGSHVKNGGGYPRSWPRYPEAMVAISSLHPRCTRVASATPGKSCMSRTICPLAPLPDWVRALCQETTRRRRSRALATPFPTISAMRPSFVLGPACGPRAFRKRPSLLHSGRPIRRSASRL